MRMRAIALQERDLNQKSEIVVTSRRHCISNASKNVVTSLKADLKNSQKDALR
jgi:hypothetical protein